jgi:hypothetical protein
LKFHEISMVARLPQAMVRLAESSRLGRKASRDRFRCERDIAVTMAMENLPEDSGWSEDR